MYELTMMDHLVAFLTSARSTKIFRQNLYRTLQEKHTGAKREQVRQYLHRLKKKGVIRLDGYCIYVSRKQIKRLDVSNNISTKPKGTSRIIVFYDIPESMRFARRLIRDQLKLWDYKFIQQSVWLGPGPLPDTFIRELKRLNIYEYLHILEVNKKH